MARERRWTRGRQATVRLVGTVRRGRAALLLGTALQASTLLLLATPGRAQPAANARPSGGVVTAGSASIGSSAGTTTITQSSQRTAINWQSFDVGSQQTVDFVQPSASAVALNRVISPNPSQIAGKIDANGQIILINQSGVMFYQGAQVNTAGLIVSAAGMSNATFMAGKLVFDQAANPNAAVVNQGTLTVRQAGLAALVAPQVANSGVITARLGHVVLAGAKTATLDLYGDGLVSLDVNNEVTQAPAGPDGKPVTALVTNTGVIRADGGTVQLTAREADGLVQDLVQAGGTIAANSVGSKTGTVALGGLGGSIVLSGVVTADGSAPGSTGGQVQADASQGVTLAGGSRISASGPAGGGTVAIGTTLTRAKGGPGTASALTASTVEIAQGASIAADATAAGDGGRVGVLSSLSTSMAGDISARGGPQGGNGGFVEVSGHALSLTGLVNTSAPMGTIGTLLLDPSDLWISDTEPSVAVYTVVAGDLPTIGAGQAPDASTVSWVSPALLQTQDSNISLAATNNLFVAASNGTTNTLSLSGLTLTLTAGNNLTIDRGFTITADNISLVATGGAITLGGSSGVTGGLITSGQLNALGPTSLQVTEFGNITMNAATGIALADSTLGSADSSLDVLDLSTASGGVSQAATGAIVADVLTSSAGLNGNVELIGTSNDIAGASNLVNSGGDITLVDNTADLLLANTISGNNLFFEVAQAGGTLSLGVALPQAGAEFATLTAAMGGRISLVADNITEEKGSRITVDGGTVELAPFSAINTSLFGTVGVSSGLVIDALLASIIDTDGTSTLVLGGFTNVPAGATTPSASASSITLDGAADLTATVTTLGLFASGSVTEPTGPLTVGTLTGNAGTVTLDNNGNDITTLGSFATTGGAFTLADGGNTGALTVAGPVTSSGAITLSTSGTGAIDATGSIGAAAGAALAITSGSGGIALSGNAALTGGTVALNGGSGGITLGGASVLGATGDVVDLTTTGGVSESGTASIVAATLQSSGGVTGAVTLGTTNAVASVGSFTVSGAGNGFQLVDSGNLAVAGPLSAPGNIALSTSGAGSVTATGNIGAGAGATLSIASGSGGIALQGAAVLGAAGDVVDLTTAAGGGVSETGMATIVAATLQSSGGVGGAVALGNANAIGTVGGFAVSGAGNGFQLADTGNLAVSGPLTAPGSITLSTSGAGSVTATGNIGAGAGATLSIASGSGGVTLNGDANLTGGTVALNGGSGGITLEGTSVLGAAGEVVDLTTGAGGTVNEAGTATVVAATLQSSGGVGGSVMLTNTNAVATLGNFTVNAPGNAFQLDNGPNLLVSGVLDATDIALRAPDSVISLGNGATIVTGGTAPGGPGPLNPKLEPENGAPGAFIEALSFDQIGSSTLAGQGGVPPTLQISIFQSAQFDAPLGLQANNGWLILNLADGTAAGNVFVNALNVTYREPGGTNLFGSIDGITGGAAAASGFIQPSPNQRYLFNNCEIAGPVCTAGAPPEVPPLYPILPGLPTTTSLPTLEVIALPLLPAPADALTDPDVVPPNISYVDY